MDSEGYLPVSLIASFNRVQALTSDINFIVQSVQDSDVVETTPSLKVRSYLPNGFITISLQSFLIVLQFRSKTDPTKWPITVDEDDMEETGNVKELSRSLPEKNLNPNVPEFVPSFSQTHKADDEDGTDGDDEAEDSFKVDVSRKKKNHKNNGEVDSEALRQSLTDLIATNKNAGSSSASKDQKREDDWVEVSLLF